MTWDYAAQPKEMLTACNLCGGSSFDQYASEDRYGLPVSSVQCRSCTLVFINPRMTAQGYAKFYADGIYRALLAERFKRDVATTMDVTQTFYGHWLIWFLAPYLDERAGTFLDVGGSEGGVADTICKRFRFAATVLEPSRSEAAASRAKGLEVIEDSIETWDAQGRQYDMVTLCQTVDHLLDIRSALGKIRSVLRPGGLFFVDLSDYRKLLYRGRKRERVIKVDHPFYLTPMTMERYLTGAGFVIKDRIGGWHHYQSAFLCEAA